MAVITGFRKTAVGTLPEDWPVRQLDELKPFVTSGSRGWASYYAESGGLFVRITNLSRESIWLDLTDCKYVRLPIEAREGVRTHLQEGDVLISITADIGIVGYVDARIPSPAYINQHIALVRLDSANADGKFISYFLASDAPQRVFRSGTDTGAKAGMSLLTIRQLLTAVPPLAEQRAIAAALSDVDSLLEALDRLIAKKRDLRQAVTPSLLNGRVRLPGFESPWEQMALGDCALVLKGKGLARSSLTEDGEIPCILYGELFTRYGREIESVASRTNCQDGVPSVPGDVLVPGSTTTTGIDLATASALAIGGVALGGDINIIRPDRTRVHSAFLANSITYTRRRDVAELAQGTTIHHLYGRDLSRLILPLPSIAEQSAIAAVLADMDKDVTALEARRAKTQAVKTAMMQELLTGRTRLVAKESSHA